MKRNLLVAFFVFSTTVALSQQRTTLDSLKSLLRNSKQDTIRALALRDLCVEFRTIDSDSSLLFGQRALDLSKQINFPRGVARAYSSLSFLYFKLETSSNHGKQQASL